MTGSGPTGRAGPFTAWVLLPLALLVGCKNITGGQAEPGAVGAACAEDEDCFRLKAPDCLAMPGGYCSEACSGGAFDCDEQSVCEALFDQVFRCLDGCLVDNGNGDCRSDYRCSVRPDVANLDGREVGVCLPRCETDADCEPGRRCNPTTGDCLPRGELATGAACRAHSTCNGGLCLTDARFRGGYCSARCGSHFEGCEPGSTCQTLDGAAVCLATCAGDEDCRAGERYACRPVGERRDQQGAMQPVRVCLPRCEGDADCAEGEHCDARSGACAAGAGAPNPLGAFCAGDADCESGTCLTHADWPNGYCTMGCGAGCPDDSECRPTPAGDRCLAACQGDLDCRLGYVCAAGACAAPCRDDGDCPGEAVCEPRTGRCMAPGSGAVQVTEVEVARGVTVRGQLSAPLTLDVPTDAIGFTLLASGSGRDLMVVGQIVDPAGRKVYDFEDPFGSALRAFPSEDVVTQMVPTSPRSAPTPGTWTFRLIKDGGPALVDVIALVKTADGVPETSRLDVNFFFARLDDLTAAGAPGDAQFQEVVAELRRLYADRGIEIRDVGYCALTGADADRYSVVDTIDGPDSELSRMFAQSGRAGDLGCLPGPALNFFLVDEIVGGRSGYIILGIAGGIPGPPGIHGTTHSGVAVTMAGFRRKVSQIALTMAHEGGHYLGLFHTTEAEGTAFDPLPDTPECHTEHDTNDDGLVDYQECLGGRGAENLMFWAAGREAREVSADQAFVLQRNPTLR